MTVVNYFYVLFVLVDLVSLDVLITMISDTRTLKVKDFRENVTIIPKVRVGDK